MSLATFQILLIDDDEDDYVNIGDLLKEITRDQYKITWKSSYGDGLEALQKNKFDACLLDYRLGAQTGLDLLKETYKIGISCPIILLTGHGDLELDLQAMQVGASDYLVKAQLTPQLLERTIRYAMKHALDMEEIKENKAQILQQDRLASLGLLASSLAHEIGTPLGIIRSRAQLVEKRSVANEANRQDMITIVNQIDRITKLVNSLLHLAREKQSNVAAAVDLNLVIRDILNLIQHELDRKGILLEATVPDGTFVKAESGPLGQVFLNLLINSVHAIEEAKKQGRIDGHHIKLTVENKLDSVDILAEDTGCGIPEKNLSQLFKPFFTTKDIGSGTGLGLATSYKLVESWNGSISTQSKENVGTIFKIHLLRA